MRRAAAVRIAVTVGRAATSSLLAAALTLGAASSLGAQQPVWVTGADAKPTLQGLWAATLETRREQVACLGGEIRADTVLIQRIRPVAEYSDSLTASAQASLATCAPPEWMGTVHSHVRSTDDPAPATRFSSGDRAVMSAWSQRWQAQGAFCLIYSAQRMHCELYPPRRSSPSLSN